jgi:hypothetical protein
MARIIQAKPTFKLENETAIAPTAAAIQRDETAYATIDSCGHQ